MNSHKRFKIGPGLIVTAAFIGPGTVTTCTLAGAGYGYSLLWAIIFAVIATYVLQEMSGRVGLAGKTGLGEAIYNELTGKTARIFGIVMIVVAVGIGNAALQTGNILGASLGLSALTGIPDMVWPLIVGGCAFVLLWFGTYKSLEKVFIGIVVLMSCCFIITAAVIQPDFSSILRGAFVPRLTDSNFYIALGLVGTTIVPYNFFIYASAVQQKWDGVESIKSARLDMLIAVCIGGLISMAIIITSSAAFYGSGVSISSARDMALQLEPLLGTWARAAVALGLFGAGMSSATTAPLGAAIAIAGVFRWEQNMKSFRFRAVWCSVLATGVLFASIGLQPVPAIIFAQAANGVLIPVVSLFLLYVVNKKRLLGMHINSTVGNTIAGVIILITLLLAARGVMRLVEFIGL